MDIDAHAESRPTHEAGIIWGKDWPNPSPADIVDMAIYTGSSSGIPSTFRLFEAPDTDDPELIADRVQMTAASLRLVESRPDPLKSREYILLSALITHEWQNGRALDLPTLIERIQNPPFAKVGVLDLETFYPAKERFAFVMAVNIVLAAPGFAAWRQGDSLDAGKEDAPYRLATSAKLSA
jgi:hypothetical protein